MGERERQTERRNRDKMRKREHREHREEDREQVSLTPSNAARQIRSTDAATPWERLNSTRSYPNTLPFPNLLLGRHIQQHIPPAARNVRHVPVPRQRLHNRLARLNLSQRKEPIPRLLQRPRHRRSRLGLPLCTDHSRLSLLLSLSSHQQHALYGHSILTFSTMNLARSASVPASARYPRPVPCSIPCCAICLASTAYQVSNAQIVPPSSWITNLCKLLERTS